MKVNTTISITALVTLTVSAALALGLPSSVMANEGRGEVLGKAGQGIQVARMSSADMQTMMNQCMQMRQQMQQKQDAIPSADMQWRMAQCDQMSKVYGEQPNLGHRQGIPSIPQRDQRFPDDRGYGLD